MTKKILCIVFCLIIILQMGLFAFADDSITEERVIHIKNEHDLIKLSHDCILDSYSKKLQVYLDNDISLTEPFSPIPVFSGTFYGQNHCIKHFSLATDGSHQGFFRYVQENGIVKDLTIEGMVNPESSRSQVGGLCGVNYGKIISCIFSGSVSGLNYVGGIAGANYGTIDNCTVKGKVQGKRFTGGICGICENNGEILSCVNYSNVNTEISEGGIDIDKINITNALENINFVSVQSENIVADTGGISGNNLGNIISCSNEGKIGYQHYGYNVGGISGRQSGYLYNCTNNAEIYGKNDIAGIVGQMEPYLLLKDRTTITDAISALASNTEFALRRFRNNTSEYSSEIEAATYSLQSAYDTAKLYQDETDPDKKRDLLEEMRMEIQYSMDALQQLGPKLQNTVDYATVDFNNVNYSTYTVLNLIAAALNGNSITNIYEDTSNVNDENEKLGHVTSNINNGKIQGDKNVGGITGNISIELDFDMEGALLDIFQDRIEEGIEANRYESKTVCSNNINNGEITSKKDYCGGIVGYQDIGTIYKCENYGNVISLKSFCGGIAGRSNSKILTSYAMCNLEGNEYVGGIAGFGKCITNCSTLVSMENATAAFGAIAGYVSNLTEDNFCGNQFVSDDLGAFDGISYDGLAQSESYSSFMADESIPERMKNLTISFRVDDNIIKVVPVEYDGSISDSQIPNVPVKKGFTGIWSDFNKEHIQFSLIVDAQYESNLGALASSDIRDNSMQPIIVVDGEFDRSASVSLTPYSMDNHPQVDEKLDSLIESFSLIIDSNSMNTSNSVSVHYLPKEETNAFSRYRIFTKTKFGDWKEAEISQIGSYLEFSSPANSFAFCVYNHKDNSLIYILISAVVLILVIAVFIIYKKMLNKKKLIPTSIVKDNLNDDTNTDDEF